MQRWVLFLFALPLTWAQLNSGFLSASLVRVKAPSIVGDFNMDGRADFVAAEDSSFRIYLGGEFSLIQGGLLPDPVLGQTALVSADFNGDGTLDLALLGLLPTATASQPHFGLRVYKGDGNGGFKLGSLLNLPDGANYSIVAEDFDRDGNADVILVNAAGVYLLKGDGAGAFTVSGPSPGPITKSQLNTRVNVADMNADSLPDLIIGWDYSFTSAVDFFTDSGRGVSVGINDGTGHFNYQTPISDASGSIVNGVAAVGDFNNDHVPDVLMSIPNGFQIYLNNGAGQLQPNVSNIDVPSPGTSAVIADFNLDGVFDFAASATPPDDSFTYIAHNASGIFTIQYPQLPGDVNGPLYTADFNGDLRPDLLVSLQGSGGKSPTSAQLYYNASSRSFTVFSQVISLTQTPNQTVGASIAMTASATSGQAVRIASRTPTICSALKGTVTTLAGGTCTIVAFQPGDQYYAPGVATMSFTITQPTNTQTITFAPISDQGLAASPLTLSASASSGLPVSFSSSTTSVCTVSGSSVTLLAQGTCTITASQSGNATYQAAASVVRSFQVVNAPTISAITNAASNVPGFLAPSSYAAMYGVNLGSSPTLSLRDSTGAVRSLTITYSSATQINFLLPANVAPGSATVTVSTSNGTAQFNVTIANTVPGLFSSDSSGKGPAAAQVLIVNADKSVTTRLVADGPIPVVAGTEIYLVLYGTGIRGHAANGVIAKIAGRSVDVLYAGDQGAFPGLDQVNLRVPLTVGGFGSVEIQLTVDGSPSNIVTAIFQ